MSNEKVVLAVVCWICALIFGAIGLWAFKRKDPMHFWSGSKVRAEEITDIASYNRANGLMWTVYSLCTALAGIVALFNMQAGTILLVIVSVPGIIILIIVYKRIYSKYKNPSPLYKTDDSKRKKSKGVIVAKTLFYTVLFIAVAVLFYYGEKSPDTKILDDHIKIEAMYGVEIDFSEILEISLIEESMSDIGIGIRSNGYGGFGGSLKGNFKSDSIGDTLLFVYAKSSPTIKIERVNKKDIYISFRNGEKTEELYTELIKTLGLKTTDDIR